MMVIYLVSTAWIKGLFSPSPIKIVCLEDQKWRSEVDCLEIYMRRLDSILDNHYEDVQKAWARGNHKPLGTYHRYQN
jgi:hypothetical protein